MKNIQKILVAAAAVGLATVGGSKAETGKEINVYKTPWCGCCQAWVEAMEKAGYTLKVYDMEDLTQVKKQAGVNADVEACHTAVLDTGRKYVLEGHVPMEAVEKLMTERPDIRGIATPGMPSGSLGMGFDEDAKYEVYAFTGNSADTPTVFYEAGKK